MSTTSIKNPTTTSNKKVVETKNLKRINTTNNDTKEAKEKKEEEKRDSGIEIFDSMVTRKEHEKLLKLYVDLKEEYSKLKANEKDKNMAVINSNILENIRMDLKVADSWLKVMSKENLSSFVESSEFMLLEYGGEILTEYHQDKDTKLGSTMMYSCNCNSCYIRRSDIKDSLFRINNNRRKRFVITRNANFEAIYPEDTFYYVNKVSEDGLKVVELTDKKDSKVKITFKFEIKKENKMKDTDYNFGKRKVLPVEWKNNMYEVSLFSMIVAMSMRSMRNNKVMGLISSFNCKENSKMDCFKKTINTLMNKDFLMKEVTSWNELSYEEEIILLTEIGEKEVHIYLKNGLVCSLENHISLESFSNSHSIKLKQLSYPMCRYWQFFADEEKEFSWVSEPEEEDEEGVELETQGHNSEIEEYDYEKVEEKMEKLSVWESETIEGKKFKETFEKYKGVIETDFIKSILMEKMSNKSYTNMQLNCLLDSKYSNIFWKNENYDPKILMLVNMSFKQFKTIMYFAGSKKNMIELVLNSPILSWHQMWSSVPSMFYEEFCNTMELNEDNFNFKLKEFMEEIDRLDDLNSTYISLLFKIFKDRVFQISTVGLMGLDEDMEDIVARHDKWVEKNSLENKFERDIYFRRFEIKSKVKENDKFGIKRFQPSTSTSQFLKSFNWSQELNTNMIIENLKMEKIYMDFLSDRVSHT